jgi:hypothetical protein
MTQAERVLVLLAVRGPEGVSVLDHPFWTRVDASGDCWTWTGGRQSAGYGHYSLGRRGLKTLAHRFAYELLVGPIPEGRQIDHLCRNHLCVNPDHMEPVTQRTNILRGTSPAAAHARVQTCPSGHPYDEANTCHRSNGRRSCRTCSRQRNNARYHARKVAA